MPANKAWRAIVTQQHKLAVDVEGKVTHLFDLTKDPYEMHNLAGETLHAALEKDLLSKLRNWSKKTGDPFPKTPACAKKMYDA